MTRAALVLIALAWMSGCRTPHLGPNTGVVYRAALDAQVDASTRPDDGPGFDADVARGALETRRRGPASRRSATPASTTVVTTAAAPAPSSSGAITLEAR